MKQTVFWIFFYFAVSVVFSIKTSALNSFLDWWLITFRSVDWSRNNASFAGNSRFAAITVQLKKFADVEFGLLQYLHFADVDIVKGVDTLARLFNILADWVGDQLVDNLWKLDEQILVLIEDIAFKLNIDTNKELWALQFY